MGERTCEAIEAMFSYGPVLCMKPAVGEAIDATWGTVHAVCEEHLPGWVECDHNCDPTIPEARRPDASHFLDCPVWASLQGA